MNVLIIAEDPIKDQHMLKPIIEAMLSYLGKATAKVAVHQERSGGFGQALRKERIGQIVKERRYNVDVFIECIDRDCQHEGNPAAQQNRRRALDFIEGHIRQEFPNARFLAENAIEEIEVWVLAGLDWKAVFPGWSWHGIRADWNPKEAYFEPLAKQPGVFAEPGNGRQPLGEQAARQYARKLRVFCKEDLLALEERVRDIG
ncbi:MAG: hypothetical protein ABSH34_20975 [Verrucomicrobiota bacterium]|jgi:hypothetical protein